jgi:catechol 2,3-dioxygenase-like lactoylglutathione lyase family enzyme
VIQGLHHNAYRCRDSEETRGFYEDFLSLRLVSAFEIYRDTWSKELPKGAEIFLLPRLAGG